MVSMRQGIAQRLPLGLKLATKNMMTEVNVYLVHRGGVAQARGLRGASGLKLHLGCGNNPKPGWVNVDLKKSADIRLDLREPLPFQDASCSLVYSEHFVEHLDYPEPAGSFVKECYRVLQPGGVLSLAVPDIELVLRSYVLGGTEEYYAQRDKHYPAWCRTEMERINFNFSQMGEHRFSYDFETLQGFLESAGFRQVRQRSFDPALDSREREFGSLYADCAKPETTLEDA